jgi:hypothetical protein
MYAILSIIFRFNDALTYFPPFIIDYHVHREISRDFSFFRYLLEKGLLLNVIADKRADPVYMKVNKEAVLIGFGFVFAAFSSDRVNEGGIGFFTDFGQMKAFAFISGPFFDEHIGCVWIGLEVFVSETWPHDKCDGIFVCDVWPGINGEIDLTSGI